MHVECDLSKLGGVVFAIPCYDGKVPVEVMQSLINTLDECKRRGIRVAYVYERGNALIDACRNRLAHKFLQQEGYQKLVFIDADITWTWESMERLLVWASMYPVVSGVYCTKQNPPKFFVNPVYTECGKVVVNEYGLVRHAGLGLGFTCIDRTVFERLSKSTPKYLDRGETYTQYFACGIVDGRYYGEDIWFFRKWQENGGECWLDPEIELKHIGHHTYEHQFKHSYAGFIAQAEEQASSSPSPDGAVLT